MDEKTADSRASRALPAGSLRVRQTGYRQLVRIAMVHPILVGPSESHDQRKGWIARRFAEVVPVPVELEVAVPA